MISNMKNKQPTTHILIETPKGSRQKFDYNPLKQCFELTRVLPAGMEFPFDFGFIPGTLGQDGDPVDVLLISECSTFSGCLVESRIIGVIQASQQEKNGEKVTNDRFIAVPIVSQAYAAVHILKDLPRKLMEEIEQFFVNYTHLAGKSFKVTRRSGSRIALKLIEAARKKAKLKQVLIQIFLPLKKNITSYHLEIEKLTRLLNKKFGGLSIYRKDLVQGLWNDRGGTEQDKLRIIEVMADSFDQEFWEGLKMQLQQDLAEDTILIRWLKIGTVGLSL
jgi:inorganic pyrophosphatase